MADVDSLLKNTEDKNWKKRRDACKELGKLDKQIGVVMDRLNYLAQNDDKDKVREEARKAYDALSKKPLEEPLISTDDDGVVEEGEMAPVDNLSKEEEDRREAEAEGKGLLVKIIETNKVKMDYYGNLKEKLPSEGVIIVQNTGSRSRISGVDLLLKNVEGITSEEGLDESNPVGLVKPGKDNAWQRTYSFDKEFEPIKVEQTYEDPETGLSPNFLGGDIKNFECKIKITNTSDVPVKDVIGKKLINTLGNVEELLLDNGEISKTNDGVEFKIAEIGPGETVEAIIKLSAALPNDVPAYKSGELNVEYTLPEFLTSGIEFGDIDGVSNVKQRVKRRQQETEPTMYDCEITFENLSEFVYDLKRFTVFQDNLDNEDKSDLLVFDWIGENASEDEREIVPGEKKTFPFEFESPEGPPSFGNYMQFSVQHELEQLTKTIVSLPEEELKFMALAITKAYIGPDGQEISEYELPSYVDTPVPTRVTVKGVGTYPLEAVRIRDQIPDGFEEPNLDGIKVYRNGIEVPADKYSTEVTTDEEGVRALQISLDHLEETEEGGFKENEELRIDYTATALRPEQREEPIYAKSVAEAWVYEAPDAIVRTESEYESLKLIVVHRRAVIDIAKQTISTEYDGMDAYEIELEADNVGTATTDIIIEDMIPDGFELIESTLSMEPEGNKLDVKTVNNGNVHGFEFKSVEPDTTARITYTVVQREANADPRLLQRIYRG